MNSSSSSIFFFADEASDWPTTKPTFSPSFNAPSVMPTTASLPSPHGLQGLTVGAVVGTCHIEFMYIHVCIYVYACVFIHVHILCVYVMMNMK